MLTTAVSMPGQVVGTLSYLSPEQAARGFCEDSRVPRAFSVGELHGGQ